MNFLNTVWTWLVSLLKKIWTSEAPALVAWLQQFKTDTGSLILQECAIYGPQIFAGTITITDAAAKVEADLIAKGISEVASLAETIFNALRTQTNLAATQPAITTAI